MGGIRTKKVPQIYKVSLEWGQDLLQAAGKLKGLPSTSAPGHSSVLLVKSAFIVLIFFTFAKNCPSGAFWELRNLVYDGQ